MNYFITKHVTRNATEYLTAIYLFGKESFMFACVVVLFWCVRCHKSSSHDFITVTSNQLKKKAKNHNVCRKVKMKSTASQMCTYFAHGKPRAKPKTKIPTTKPDRLHYFICSNEKMTKKRLQQIRMEIRSLGMHAFSLFSIPPNAPNSPILAFAIWSTPLEYGETQYASQCKIEQQ